jgi:hypothetical protein
MKRCSFFAVLSLCLLASCGGEWTSGGTAGVEIGESWDELPMGRRAQRAVSAGGANEIFILDNNRSVYRFVRDGAAIFRWNLDRDFGSLGVLDFDGAVDDLGYAAGEFFGLNGNIVSRSDGAECAVGSNKGFAAAPSGASLIVAGSTVKEYEFSGNGCRLSQTVFPNAALAVAQGPSAYFAVLGSTTPVELAVAFKGSASVWREPLSLIEGNEKNFCSAERLVSNGVSLFLLDTKCRKLGVFYSDGAWLQTIPLDGLSLGASVLDVMAGDAGSAYLLLSNGKIARVRIPWNSF